MHLIAYALAGVLYTVASIRYVMRFAQARAGATPATAVVMYGGVASHILGLTSYWAAYGEPPLVGLGPSLASLSLLIAIAAAGLGLFNAARAVGLILAPVAAGLLVVSLVVGIQPAGSELAFRGPWLVFHVSAAFIGYAGWMVAAASGLMYLLQFRELKHKQFGAIFEFFPPLSILERVSEWSLVTGFSALTIGIAVGWAWTIRFEHGLRWGDPKIIWGVAAWLALMLALRARLSRRSTSRQAALWNVTGFAVVSLAYLVTRLMEPSTRFFL